MYHKTAIHIYRIRKRLYTLISSDNNIIDFKIYCSCFFFFYNILFYYLLPNKWIKRSLFLIFNGRLNT